MVTSPSGNAIVISPQDTALPTCIAHRLFGLKRIPTASEKRGATARYPSNTADPPVAVLTFGGVHPCSEPTRRVSINRAECLAYAAQA